VASLQLVVDLDLLGSQGAMFQALSILWLPLWGRLRVCQGLFSWRAAWLSELLLYAAWWGAVHVRVYGSFPGGPAFGLRWWQWGRCFL